MSPAAEPLAGPTVAAPADPTPLAWTRTELYFGMSKDGRRIPRAAWRRFVDEHVLIALPDGFTVWEAEGAWQKAGVPYREPSRVLVVVWDPARGDAPIESLRRTWIVEQDQDAVMRVDAPAEVGFEPAADDTP